MKPPKSGELTSLKAAQCAYIFIRKIESEDGIILPFTYAGTGKMHYLEGSLKPNGAHLFHIQMQDTAPEDIYYDFKLF